MINKKRTKTTHIIKSSIYALYTIFVIFAIATHELSFIDVFIELSIYILLGIALYVVIENTNLEELKEIFKED